jgi:ATP-dependent DNA helicase RecQ
MTGVLNFVRQAEGHGLIYCGTKVETEIYANWLIHNGISATFYNAGLDNESRVRIEEGLMENAYKCVVSTNALGMGLDKSDVRFVVHTQVPQSPLSYYQEIGRAGRDGRSADILLFYHPEDDKLPLSFINGSRPSRSLYERVIAVVQQQPLGERAILKAANLKQTAIKVILADLKDQGILVQNQNSKHYEYKFGAPPLETAHFDTLRQAKMQDFDQMKAYIETGECRMRFLTTYLGDDHEEHCGKCDRDLRRTVSLSANEADLERISVFRESYFPSLELNDRSGVLDEGVAASYYGVSNVGQAIKHSKYEGGGDFPDFLLRLFLKAFRKLYGQEVFDLVLYVPPTKSGDLVKNFATKVAGVLKFPISDALVKTRETQEQKVFESGYSKEENCRGAFGIDMDVAGKSILLIDDVFDSGHTIKAIAALLKIKGAKRIVPMVIAKTVGGR